MQQQHTLLLGSFEGTVGGGLPAAMARVEPERDPAMTDNATLILFHTCNVADFVACLQKPQQITGGWGGHGGGGEYPHPLL